MTDPHLIDAHLHNDPNAFPALVARHIDFVHGIAARQCPAHADDITQAVFLLLSQKARSLQGCATLHGWLFHTTLLCAKNALRADRRRQSHEREAAMQPRPVSSQNETLLPLLDQAIASLPTADRELLLLRHFQNQQLADIAAHLRISLPAATKRLQRATEKLRTWFSARGQTPTHDALAALFLSAAAHRAPHTLSAAVSTATTPAAATLAKGTLTTMARLKLQTAALWGTIAAACLLVALSTTAAYSHFHHPPTAPAAIAAPIAAVPTRTIPPTPTALTPISAPDPTEITITGTVKDAAGNPIDHAFVSQGRSPFARSTFHYTYTNPDGTFTLTRIKPGDDLLLTATASGYSPQVIQAGKLLANPAPADFTLPPGHTLKLHFVDQRGNPVAKVLANPVSWQKKDVLRSTQVVKNSFSAMKPFMSDDNGDITWDSAPADPVDFMYSQAIEHPVYRRGGGPFTASDKTITITLKDALVINATVVDSKTHQPIPDFTFYTGNGDNNATPYGWYPEAHPGQNGAFSYTDPEFSKFAFIRVEAPGYPPAVQSVLRDNSPATLTFNLSAADALHLTVLTPDRQPADNVRVYIATGSNTLVTVPITFHFANDSVQKGISPSDPPFQTTDADGHCLLADPGKTPARILVLAPDGYAERLPAELRANPTITLEPWASLDLHIHNADIPLAHTLVEILYTIPKTPGAPSITISLRTKTSATGDVSFLRLPPRNLAIAYQLIANENTPFAQYVSNTLKTLIPTPGQSLDLPLPDNGHAITGKLVNPDSSPLPAHSYFSVAKLQPPPFRSLLTPEELKEAHQPPAGDYEKWKVNFEKQNAQRIAAYQKARDDYEARHAADPFLINPDGSFHATNIPPGDYLLEVSLLDPTTGKEILTLSHPFTMPATPTTLNLGNLPLQKPSPPK